MHKNMNSFLKPLRSYKGKASSVAIVHSSRSNMLQGMMCLWANTKRQSLSQLFRILTLSKNLTFKPTCHAHISNSHINGGHRVWNSDALLHLCITYILLLHIYTLKDYRHMNNQSFLLMKVSNYCWFWKYYHFFATNASVLRFFFWNYVKTWTLPPEMEAWQQP